MKLAYIIPAVAIAAVLLIPACRVSKPYTQPPVQTDGLYRDVVTKDTTTIADIPWKRMFKNRNLQTLLQQGISNNYDLQIAVARIKQAEANLRQTRAAFFPTISGGPQVTQQKFPTSKGLVSFGTDRVYGLSVNASWEIDLWGKLKSANRGAIALLLQSEASRRTVQTQLVSDIASNYFNLLAYDKQLAITIETVENRRNDVETNKALKDANRITEAAVAQSEANRYAAEVTIPDLQNNIRQTENSISILLGKQPGSILRDSISDQQVDTMLQTGVPAQLLANRPDVQEAEYGVRYYFQQMNVARAYFYPSLTITAQGGWQGVTVSTLFNSTGMLGSVVGGLTQPIFNKGINKQRLQVAKAQYEENVAYFQQTVLYAGQEVSDALYSYQAVANKTITRDQQLGAWKRAVDYNRELLKNGYATYTDVLTSEQGYLSAQLNSITDRLQSLTAIVSLYRGLGGGWK
ncbi:MAG: efflux transporter outer membrane subunit [Chitinophagaceae bacterium]